MDILVEVEQLLMISNCNAFVIYPNEEENSGTTISSSALYSPPLSTLSTSSSTAVVHSASSGTTVSVSVTETSSSSFPSPSGLQEEEEDGERKNPPEPLGVGCASQRAHIYAHTLIRITKTTRTLDRIHTRDSIDCICGVIS